MHDKLVFKCFTKLVFNHRLVTLRDLVCCCHNLGMILHLLREQFNVLAMKGEAKKDDAIRASQRCTHCCQFIAFLYALGKGANLLSYVG